MEATTRNTDDPELRAWTDMYAAALGRSLGLGLGVVETSGGTALVASKVDSLLFNRAVARDVGEVEELGRIYRDRAIGRFMITLPRGAEATIDPAPGLERFRRPWIKLAGPPKPQVIELDGYSVRPARPEDAEAVPEEAEVIPGLQLIEE